MNARSTVAWQPTACCLVLLSGCATESPQSGSEEPEPLPASAQVTEPAADESAERDPLLDRTQQRLFRIVSGTSRWVDGFFGSAELQEDSSQDVTRGLLALGQRWDERDEFDTSVRFRAQIPLPALERRTRLLLGRGDTDEIVDGSETETINALPEQFSDFSDDDWLLGLGYGGRGGAARGFDAGIGASFSSGKFDPYVRLSYRWSQSFGERWFWWLRPRVFWQEERGEGVALNTHLDYVLNPEWLLRKRVNLLSDQVIDGVRWKSEWLAYQSINNDNAMSYRVFAIGETGDPVKVQDYGFEVRYRRRAFREWFFLEFSGGVTWPREEPVEVRGSNFGVGIEFEMQFGDWPGRSQNQASK